MYIYIQYINIYIYICIILYTCSQKKDNVLSRLFSTNGLMVTQGSTWAHEVQLNIADIDEPKSGQQVKQGAS